MFTASGIKRDRAQDSAWRTQTVRQILLRERNAGRLVVKGVMYASDLPQLIDPETFDAAKAILENPARAPRRGPKPKTWTAVGTVRCGTCGSFLSQTVIRRDGARHMRCAPGGRPVTTEKVRHGSMEAVAMERQLGALVLAKLTQRRLRGESFVAAPAPVAGLRLRVAELVRQRDIAQDLVFTPGVNIAAAKRKLLELSEGIETAQAELDATLSSDVATAAVAAAEAAWDEAMALPAMTDEEADAWEDDPANVGPGAFLSYWAALPIEDRRTLVKALLPGAKLMPVGQEVLGFRVSVEW